MPNYTNRLGLITWLESDAVDFEQINSNFTKIDSLDNILEYGTKTAAFSGADSTSNSSNANWHYKIYSDGTIDMSAKLSLINLRTSGGSSSPYYSGYIQANFPFSMSDVFDVQMHLATYPLQWISNVTGPDVSSYVKFRLLGLELETATNEQKTVYINVKGVINNG